VDSVSLFNEVEEYDVNVTDFIHSIYVYGTVNIFHIDTIITILLKYGAEKITIKK
jgi:hypothetical protein